MRFEFGLEMYVRLYFAKEGTLVLLSFFFSFLLFAYSDAVILPNSP